VVAGNIRALKVLDGVSLVKSEASFEVEAMSRT
jgi:hypothetical protein